MKKLAIALVFLTLAVTTALGNVVSIQFTGTGSNNYHGVPTFPYYGTVDSQPTTFMCVSFLQHISPGETWQANQLTVPQYGALLLGGLREADEAAWLFTKARVNPDFSNEFNAAAWYLIEKAPDITGDSEALGFYLAALSQSFANDEFNGVRVFVPLDPTDQQTFISLTPEPSSLFLLGSGVLGLAGFLRKTL